MADVFAALYRIDDAGPRVLFLKRSNGQWWLPGGKMVCNTPQNEAVQHVFRLLTLREWRPHHIGNWVLSPEAGGGDVHFFEGYLPEPRTVRIRDTSSGLSRKLAFFGEEDIKQHLYEAKDMPWGQAKMGIYCLHDVHELGTRAEGHLLKDDLVLPDGQIWERPES